MSDDKKMIITPAEAESLLLDGPHVHNYIVGPGMLMGCDYERDDAIAAFEKASLIEIAGTNAKSLRHPIAVTIDGEASFFEADMDKVSAFEARRLAN